MRILVVTSCTGEKSVDDERRLTLDEFRQGEDVVRQREAELATKLTPAERLYTGMQHARLMRGVNAIRAYPGAALDLKILSAGYGLVSSDRLLAPYEATFIGMPKKEARAWAEKLKIAEDFRSAVREPFDLALILLGDDYLDACRFDESVVLGGPTIVFSGQAAAKKLPRLANLNVVILGNADAKRFGCALIGLKGELAARILERLAADPSRLIDVLHAGSELKDLLATDVISAPHSKRSAARPNPQVDRVIELRHSWLHKPHRTQLSYFIPEWDDLVDPAFDFATDTHSGGSGDWSNEVYAHQMYPEPNYDGILISKVVAEKSKKKAERINRLGVHRYLRVPRDFPVMGDCGAFGYIQEYEPPYTTEDILDYYTRLDFDFGVSIDHFAIGEGQDRLRRYQLTIENARDFLVEHRKLGLPWTPIGAIQGWDEKSFAEAAKQYVAMGYRYVAVGSMVRRRTPEILSIVQAVREVVPREIKLHLFGVARLNAVRELARAGIDSADSASVLRRAWMGTGKNYLAMDGQQYAAIRVPEAGKSFRAKRMVSEGRASADKVERLERACLDALHAYDRGEVSVESVLDTLHEYDQLITPDRPDNRAVLRHTLEARPWKSCPCEICRKDGIDVVIFRGNNRNRRRGFHNTYVFYQLLQRALAGERFEWMEGEEEAGADAGQMSLFQGEVAVSEV